MNFNKLKENLMNEIERRTGISFTDKSLLNMQKDLKKQFFFFFFVLFSVITIYYASTDENVLSNKTYIYAAFIIIPLLLGPLGSIVSKVIKVLVVDVESNVR